MTSPSTSGYQTKSAKITRAGSKNREPPRLRGKNRRALTRTWRSPWETPFPTLASRGPDGSLGSKEDGAGDDRSTDISFKNKPAPPPLRRSFRLNGLRGAEV